MKTAEIIRLHSVDEGNAAARQIRERQVYEPMTHIEIAEAEDRTAKWKWFFGILSVSSVLTVAAMTAALHWVTP